MTTYQQGQRAFYLYVLAVTRNSREWRPERTCVGGNKTERDFFRRVSRRAARTLMRLLSQPPITLVSCVAFKAPFPSPGAE